MGRLFILSFLSTVIKMKALFLWIRGLFLRVQKIKGIFKCEQGKNMPKGTQPQQGRNTTRMKSFPNKKYFSRTWITHLPL